MMTPTNTFGFASSTAHPSQLNLEKNTSAYFDCDFEPEQNYPKLSRAPRRSPLFRYPSGNAFLQTKFAGPLRTLSHERPKDFRLRQPSLALYHYVRSIYLIFSPSPRGTRRSRSPGLGQQYSRRL